QRPEEFVGFLVHSKVVFLGEIRGRPPIIFLIGEVLRVAGFHHLPIGRGLPARIDKERDLSLPNIPKELHFAPRTSYHIQTQRGEVK
ncbi:hypothetical protein, partial [Thermococcus sp. PK]|uniref:hypothetical protein n=1 Tax=Thermococcus sp. PK TaxID=913025 RepID=UPI001E2AEED5